MQEDVTVNITVPKELVPALTVLLEGLKKAVTSASVPSTNGNTSISISTTGTEVKPSREEVLAFCRNRNSTVDGNRFWNWAENHKWKDAKGNPIVDWKSKIIEWEGYRLEKTPAPGTTTSTTKNMLQDSYAMMVEWANE